MVGSWAAAAISTEPESCERFLGGTTAPDDSFCPNAVLSSNRQRAEFNTSHGIVLDASRYPDSTDKAD
jgi:hypothetical protein